MLAVGLFGMGTTVGIGMTLGLCDWAVTRLYTVCVNRKRLRRGGLTLVFDRLRMHILK